jgi:hypothetical protein
VLEATFGGDRKVRIDRIERDWRCYRGVVRWANGSRSNPIDATSRKLMAACGFKDTRTFYSALHDVEEAGLISSERVRNSHGTDRCKRVYITCVIEH